MPKLIHTVLHSWKECRYRTEYTQERDTDICEYPTGSPWCKHHPGDLRRGFPFDCPLEDAA